MNEGAGAAVHAHPLCGRRVAVAAHGLTVAEPLTRGLQRLGAKVARVGPCGVSRAAWAAAIEAATRELEGLDAVVHGGAPAGALHAGDLDALSLSDWQRATASGLFATLCCLQASWSHLRNGDGTIIVLGPSAALVGAPGLVPLITLAEAQRTLVKSAARQWGRHGIRLHWLGLATTQYCEGLHDARVPAVPELGPPPPALGRVPDAQTDAAALIALLTASTACGLTGATINLDGGDWMVP